MAEDGTLALNDVQTVLVVDWPSDDVPDTLARAGYTVVVKGGPEADSYSVRELNQSRVVSRRLTVPPEQVDLVYCHRPLDELPGIVALAEQLNARTVWRQSGLDRSGASDPKGCWVSGEEAERARHLVESAGLAYIDSVYIADAVRRRT